MIRRQRRTITSQCLSPLDVKVIRKISRVHLEPLRSWFRSTAVSTDDASHPMQVQFPREMRSHVIEIIKLP
jgi:hypothetical protein